jgi:hypothetical protein
MVRTHGHRPPRQEPDESTLDAATAARVRNEREFLGGLHNALGGGRVEPATVHTEESVQRERDQAFVIEAEARLAAKLAAKAAGGGK